MESQPLLEAESAAQNTSKVNINQASAEELTALPGIGPALAGRIVAHREEAGPFERAEEIEAIAGIGPALVAQIGERISVGTADQTAEERVALRADMPPPLPDLAIAEDELPSWLEADEVPFAEPEPFEEELDTAIEPLLEAPPEEDFGEEAPAPEEPEPLPAPPEAREPAPRRQAWVWPTLLGAVLGGLLGLILTVLLFAGINGSIDVGRSRGFRTLASQINGLSVEVDAVRGDVSALQGDLNGLRQRVEVLSGLTARMDDAERALEASAGAIRTLEQETQALQTSLDTLEAEVSTLEETVDVLELQTEKAMSFFERLRVLLEEVFGTPEGVDK
jgi:competence ComEA-like helix-hairpin-helix protein